MVDRTMRVMETFRPWLDERGLGELAEPAGAVLTARRDYGGRTDPTCWRSGDVHGLMASVVPARMTDTARIAENGVAGLGAFLDFLEDTGRLHPGSMHVKALKKELAMVAGDFEDAMADRGRWRMAKTLYEAMRAEAVDIADEDGVQGWFAQFNEAAPDRRRVVLEHLLGEQPELLEAHFTARDGSVAALRGADFVRLGPAAIPAQFRPDEPETFRPVRLASEAELAAAAQQSPVLNQAAAFVAWVGAGRAVDKKGRLAAKVADDAVAYVAERSALPFGEILLSTEIVPLAVAMEWVELRRTGLVRGARAAGLEAVVGGIADDIAVLRVWREALDLLLRPETPERQTGADLDRVAEFMDQAEPAASWAMTVLYETNEFLLFDDLFDAAIADSPLEGVTENLWAGILAMTAVRTRLHSAWRHGALDARWSNVDDRGTDVGERAPAQGLQPWYVLEAPDLAFRLTPLGTWGVHEALAAEGNIAPIS